MIAESSTTAGTSSPATPAAAVYMAVRAKDVNGTERNDPKLQEIEQAAEPQQQKSINDNKNNTSPDQPLSILGWASFALLEFLKGIILGFVLWATVSFIDVVVYHQEPPVSDGNDSPLLSMACGFALAIHTHVFLSVYVGRLTSPVANVSRRVIVWTIVASFLLNCTGYQVGIKLAPLLLPSIWLQSLVLAFVVLTIVIEQVAALSMQISFRPPTLLEWASFALRFHLKGIICGLVLWATRSWVDAVVYHHSSSEDGSGSQAPSLLAMACSTCFALHTAIVLFLIMGIYNSIIYQVTFCTFPAWILLNVVGWQVGITLGPWLLPWIWLQGIVVAICVFTMVTMVITVIRVKVENHPSDLKQEESEISSQ